MIRGLMKFINNLTLIDNLVFFFWCDELCVHIIHRSLGAAQHRFIRILVDPGVKPILDMSLVLDTRVVSSMLKQFQLLFLIQKTNMG